MSQKTAKEKLWKIKAEHHFKKKITSLALWKLNLRKFGVVTNICTVVDVDFSADAGDTSLRTCIYPQADLPKEKVLYHYSAKQQFLWLGGSLTAWNMIVNYELLPPLTFCGKCHYLHHTHTVLWSQQHVSSSWWLPYVAGSWRWKTLKGKRGRSFFKNKKICEKSKVHDGRGLWNNPK